MIFGWFNPWMWNWIWMAAEIKYGFFSHAHWVGDAVEQLSLGTTAIEPVFWGPGAATTEAHKP